MYLTIARFSSLCGLVAIAVSATGWNACHPTPPNTEMVERVYQKFLEKFLDEVKADMAKHAAGDTQKELNSYIQHHRDGVTEISKRVFENRDWDNGDGDRAKFDYWFQNLDANKQAGIRDSFEQSALNLQQCLTFPGGERVCAPDSSNEELSSSPSPLYRLAPTP